MKLHYYFFYIFIILSLPINGQIKELDSLNLLLKNSKDTCKIYKLEKIFKFYQENNNIKKANFINNQIFLLSKKHNFKIGIGFYNLNYYFMYNRINNKECLKKITLANTIFKHEKSTFYYLKSCVILADLYLLKGDVIKAKNILNNNINLAKNNKKIKLTGYFYQFLAEIELYNKQNYTKANYYLKKALYYYDYEKSSKKYYSKLYFNLAYISNLIGKHKIALEYCNKGISIVKDLKIKHFLILEKTNSLLRLKKNREAYNLAKSNKEYFKLNNLELHSNYIYNDFFLLKSSSLINNFKTAEATFNSINNLKTNDSIIKIKANITFYNYTLSKIKKNNIKDLIKKFVNFDKTLINSGDNETLFEYYNFMYRAYEKINDYKKSNTYLLKRNKIEILLIKLEKEFMLNELEFQFKINEKNNAIGILENKNLKKENDIKRKENYIIIVISITLILTLLFVNLFKINFTIKQKNKELGLLITQKEFLVKEIHHRVKNNLQLIIGLINAEVKDSVNEKILLNLQNRIISISLIHELIYVNDTTSKLSIKNYLINLVSLISKSYENKNKNISVNVISEDNFIDIDKSISLGLIVNELITNSYKHAFENKDIGNINVLHFKKNNLNFIEINDDGIYKDKITDNEFGGLKIVKIFIQQIKGKISLNTEKGTNFTITF